MKRNEKRDVNIDGSFKLSLPPELDIKPMFEVQVSKNVVGRVFTKHYDSMPGSDQSERRLGYVVQFVNPQTGAEPTATRNITGPYGYRRNVLEDLLEVKFMLEAAAHALRPKTKRTTVSEDYED